MTQLTERNNISIAQVAVYSPALLIGIFLSARHGFGRSAGWLYLVLFSLIRILGAAMDLATIHDPTNISLQIGSSTLETIGLSPLILINLGLIGRVREGISHGGHVLLSPRVLRFIQLIVIVGLILAIVGGSQLGNDIGTAVSEGQTIISVQIPTESKAGLALMIAGYGLLVIATAMVSTQVGQVEAGEKRLLGAVIAALPFVLVRLLFSALATFTDKAAFSQYSGSPDYDSVLLGMSVVMEMIVIAIIEGVGLTLRKIPKGQPANKTVNPSRV